MRLHFEAHVKPGLFSNIAPSPISVIKMPYDITTGVNPKTMSQVFAQPEKQHGKRTFFVFFSTSV